MLIYLLRTFLQIGSTSFGGYMALIAMVRERMVSRDKVIEDSTLTEGIALSSFLPGPVAVNVVAYIGYILAGFRGAMLSIIAVLLPSFIMVVMLALLYFRYESVYDFSVWLSGIIPVVVAIILSVGISMVQKNCKRIYQYIISTLTIMILFLFPGYWSSIGVLVLSGMAGIAINYKREDSTDVNTESWSPGFVWWIVGFIGIFVVANFTYVDFIGTRLFVLFSSVSLTLFGGGYVMVPLLKSMLVDQYAWFTSDEFAFGISIGQITPGPILISAAFFGYKMYGIKGAIISTIGIFLPSSMLMILATHVYQKLKNSIMLRFALMGVMPAVVGLIVYSGLSLFLNHIYGHNLGLALFILIISFVLVFKFKISPLIVLMTGGLVAYIFNII